MSAWLFQKKMIGKNTKSAFHQPQRLSGIIYFGENSSTTNLQAHSYLDESFGVCLLIRMIYYDAPRAVKTEGNKWEWCWCIWTSSWQNNILRIHQSFSWMFSPTSFVPWYHPAGGNYCCRRYNNSSSADRTRDYESKTCTFLKTGHDFGALIPGSFWHSFCKAPWELGSAQRTGCVHRMCTEGTVLIPDVWSWWECLFWKYQIVIWCSGNSFRLIVESHLGSCLSGLMMPALRVWTCECAEVHFFIIKTTVRFVSSCSGQEAPSTELFWLSGIFHCPLLAAWLKEESPPWDMFP